jgi:hypothetical protein
MVAFLKAFLSAIFEHLTKLIREDKKGVDADKTPEKLRSAFDDTIRRKYRDGMRDD